MSDLESVKALLRSVLIGSKDGVSLKKIPSEYRLLTGEVLPKFSYSTIESFLLSMPDVVRPARGPMGEPVFYAVANRSTQHLHDMVSKQRGKKKQPVKRRPLLPLPIRANYMANYSGPRKYYLPNPRHLSGPPRFQEPRYNPPPQWAQPPRKDPLLYKPPNMWEPYVEKKLYENFTITKPKTSYENFTITKPKTSYENFTITKPNEDYSMRIRHNPDYELPPRFHNKSTNLEGDLVRRVSSPGGDTQIVHYPQSCDVMPRISVRLKQDQQEEERPMSSRNERPVSSLDEVKYNLIDMLQDKPGGVWLSSLESLYESRFGYQLPLAIENFLTTWSDTFSINIMDQYSPKPHTIVCLKQAEVVLPHPPLVLNKAIKVSVMWMDSAGFLWLHTSAGHAEEFAEDVKSLSEKSTALHPKEIQAGIYCVALYEDDNNWYRAKVTEVGETIKVLFIDYGNLADIDPSCVRRLDVKLTKTPALAIQARLSGVEPKEGLWDMAVVNAVWDIVDEAVLIAVPKEVKEGVVQIELYKSGDDSSINQLLTDQGVLVSTQSQNVVQLKLDVAPSSPASRLTIDAADIDVTAEDDSDSVGSLLGNRGGQPQPPEIDLSEDDFWDVSVTKILSASSVAINIIGPQYYDMLCELCTKLEVWYDQAPDTSGQVRDDDTCVALVDDQGHCRVRVMDVRADTADCYLLDYGERIALPKTRLRLITADVNTLPYQSVKCTLAGLEPLSNDPKALEKLVELTESAQDDCLIAQVLQRSPHICVVLYYTSGDDDVNMNEVIAEACGVYLQNADAEGDLIDRNGDAASEEKRSQDGNQTAQKCGGYLSETDAVSVSSSRRNSAIKDMEPTEINAGGTENSVHYSNINERERDSGNQSAKFAGGKMNDNISQNAGVTQGRKQESDVSSLACQWASKFENDFKMAANIQSQIGVNLEQGHNKVHVSYRPGAAGDGVDRCRVDDWLTSNELHRSHDSGLSSPPPDPRGDYKSSSPPGNVFAALKSADRDNTLGSFNRDSKRPPDDEAPLSHSFCENFSKLTTSVDVDRRSSKSGSSGTENPGRDRGKVTHQSSHGVEEQSTVRKCSLVESDVGGAARDGDIWNRAFYWGLTTPDVVKVVTNNSGDLYVDFHVSCVYSPSMIYFQLYHNKNTIDSMMVKLQICFASIPKDKSLKIEEIRVEHMYAGLIEMPGGSFWHRVIVREMSHTEQKVVVYLADYGNMHLLNLRDITPLPLEFWSIPLQAFMGSIPNIVPAQGDDWNEACKYWLMSRISDLDLVGQVCDYYPETAKYSLHLVDTHTDDDWFIGILLVNEGYARFSM